MHPGPLVLTATMPRTAEMAEFVVDSPIVEWDPGRESFRRSGRTKHNPIDERCLFSMLCAAECRLAVWKMARRNMGLLVRKRSHARL